MQAPIIVFDHRSKTVATIATGHGADNKRLQELLAAQQKQVATSGRPSQ